jgi:hypothetical protein
VIVIVFSFYLISLLEGCESLFLNDSVRWLLYFFSNSSTHLCFITLCLHDELLVMWYGLIHA